MSVPFCIWILKYLSAKSIIYYEPCQNLAETLLFSCFAKSPVLSQDFPKHDYKCCAYTRDAFHFYFSLMCIYKFLYNG